MLPLWQATSALVDALRPSASVGRFAGTLNGQPQLPGSQLPQQLQMIFASYGLLRAQPFLLSMRLGHIPGGDALAADPAFDQFRRDAIAVNAAMVALVEWLRSRMPRYPIRFKLPYTDPLSSRVADQGFPDANWPWLFEQRRAGFQARPTVAPIIADALGVDESPVRTALASLERALHAGDAWLRYAEAAAALTTADEEKLSEVLGIFRAETRPEAIDAVEPNRVMRRMQHRHAAQRLAEAKARAQGSTIAEYYAAFRGLDLTLGAVITLLGQLLLNGPPRQILVRRASWRRNDERVEVSISTTDIWANLNEIVELRVELVPLSGLVVVEGVNISMHRRGEVDIEDVRLDGILLPDSA